MKITTLKPKGDHAEGRAGQDHDASRDPLDEVFARSENGSILMMQTGLFNLARNRALQSGTSEPRPEDICALEEHARAMARDTYRDRFDPTQNAHDAMHQAEHDRNLACRVEAEKTQQQSAANVRDAEFNLARTPKAGSKPAAHPLLVAAFIVVLTLTTAPTLHDSVFQTLADDLLAWFEAWLSGGFVGGMLTLAILGGRRTQWAWIGVAAGVLFGLGLGVVRLSSSEGAGEAAFAVGLTVVEIAAVLLLEWLASGLRATEIEWCTLSTVESAAIAARESAQADLDRWHGRLKGLNDAITKKIAFIEDRHNRNVHIAELEAVGVKAVHDGYNSGISENIGRLRGVPRRQS